MNLAAIRSGLAALVDNISGLHVTGYITDSMNTPAALISVGDGAYDEDFDGDTTVALSVLVLVSRAADAWRAQQDIDEYLNPTGTKSIRAAVNADPTLGGTCDSCRVIGWANYNGTYSAGNVDYGGVEIQLEAFA